MGDKAQGQGSPSALGTPLDGSTLDPFASALVLSPYVVIEPLTPDMPFNEMHRLMLRLQKQGLTAKQRAAFRQLRDLTGRLIWDLETLGTTPSVSREQWTALAELLHAGKRAEARRRWLSEIEDFDRASAAFHVCAVLSGNEIAQHARAGEPAGDDVLRCYVAFWAALLKRRRWLREFAFCRCRAWGRAAPDQGDLTQFLYRAENVIIDRLLAGAGDCKARRTEWNDLWVRERTVIDAVDKAFGSQQRPRWAQGLGPTGLQLLNREEEARTWLLKEARAYRGGVPLCALKSADARVDPRQPSLTAEAATALTLLFSTLGKAASEVWNGRGPVALTLLSSPQARADGRGGEVADRWFGQGQRARVRFQLAWEELKAEALLLQFHHGLTRSEVKLPQVCDTLRRLLDLTDLARRPNVLVERVEDLVVGRLSACLESRRLPQPAEVERIIDISREVHQMLRERHAGERCGLSLARLLKRRAVRRWSRSGNRLPKVNVQHNVLRDLIEAVELAPHNPDLAANLGRVVVQIDFFSEPERRQCLETALRYVDRCKHVGAPSPELENIRLDILDQLDPKRAAAEALRQLRQAKNSQAKETP